ncbi:hypothetical protein [Zobellella maritima]|uniref:hypothetical protein n=1 Tax=Zobellella maritima TaxID=2059725 RepID=UPI000E30075D|nr:hypothetical protein [Zobellella maritima]
MRRIATFILFTLMLASASAQPLNPEQVPTPLQPWVDWVLHGEEQRHCPFVYNRGLDYRCAWPTRLNLDLNNSGGQFSQHWRLYREGWVQLPGDERHWPQQITINGEPAVVSADRGSPRIRLAAGDHRVEGTWRWERLPESLTIPTTTGLLALTVNNNPVARANLDDNGRLWLGEASPQDRQPQGDTLTLQVHRKVEDRIPLRVITRLDLEVAGAQRELVLGPVLLDEQLPLQLDSPLPARLEPDGRLRVQVRPGRWSITLTSRHPGHITALALPEVPAPWPEQEIWAFQAFNQLRLVDIDNLVAVDPRQTRLPEAWQTLPAYLLAQGDRMQFRVIRRGDQEPEPDKLSLDRQLWLDFDGGGYTVQDTISGSMTRGWRLEATPELQLGQVTLDGEPRFITRQPGSDKVGVEVRRGTLELNADSRYVGPIHALPAAGWDTDLQRLHTRLHLPPGWALFSASGMDNAPHTWLQRWTLLDLFLVLIAAVAVYRLWGWQWGVLALLTLALSWHESAGLGAPRFVWLHLLAATALLRVLPGGRLRQTVIGYRNLSLLVLVLIAIPFMVAEVRIAMYPQLAQPGVFTSAPPGAPTPMAARESEDRAPTASPRQQLTDMAVKEMASPSYFSQSRPLPRIDPDARVQTGPGLPGWQWRSIDLGWNGPVQRDQRIHLVLLSPAANLVLNLLRVLLVGLLVLRMAGFGYSRDRGPYLQQGLFSALLPVSLLIPLLLSLPAPARAELPDDRLLRELKTRLLAPPDCLPDCAQVPRMDLAAGPQRLEIRLEIHTQEAVAVPLPAGTRHWMPSQVLVDGNSAEGLLRDPGGELYLRLPAGIHQISLSGPLAEQDSVQLPLTLRPRRVEAQTTGWILEGVHENGLPDAQLQLTRIRPEASGVQPATLEPGALPAFVRVERVLRLELDWRVETRVVRLSPAGQAVLLEIPLLNGESVLTEGVRVQGDKVLLNLPANQKQAYWQSSLEQAPSLTLTAPETSSWTEVWHVDTSPIWHLESSGIPVVHHQDAGGNWLPEWRPWPGERVELNISRPEGVEGQTLTIDSTWLQVRPGKRAVDASLRLHLRSSQGGQHSLQLPDKVSLQTVTINGRVQPIRLQGRTLTFPLTPGAQTLELAWRHNDGIGSLFTTPRVGLNSASVNNSIELVLGRDRWVLFAMGPRLGPAVLFWSLLAITLLLALALSRLPFTPLRFHHWLLLGIGLTQVPLWMALMVVAWLLALGLRGRWQHEDAGRLFNLVQIGLAALTLVALSYLFYAIQQGLLGLPDMQISGNHSHAGTLRWYQDRSEAALPTAWVLSVPLLVYRLLMLAWALWLAFSLLNWLRWGWACFSSRGIWRPFKMRIARGNKKGGSG